MVGKWLSGILPCIGKRVLKERLWNGLSLTFTRGPLSPSHQALDSLRNMRRIFLNLKLYKAVLCIWCAQFYSQHRWLDVWTTLWLHNHFWSSPAIESSLFFMYLKKSHTYNIYTGCDTIGKERKGRSASLPVVFVWRDSFEQHTSGEPELASHSIPFYPGGYYIPHHTTVTFTPEFWGRDPMIMRCLSQLASHH